MWKIRFFHRFFHLVQYLHKTYAKYAKVFHNDIGNKLTILEFCQDITFMTGFEKIYAFPGKITSQVACLFGQKGQNTQHFISFCLQDTPNC